MTSLSSYFQRPGRVVVHGAPEGHDAHVLAQLVASGTGRLVHICRDDGRMARMESALQFFAPKVEVLGFPAWDCLPYDRVSPNSEITSHRIDTLSRLAEPTDRTSPQILLTTVNAAVQRVPARKLFAGRSLVLKVGGTIARDRLISHLGRNGYVRTETVRDPGEFAVRGGIIDLYPTGSGEPLRIDFFGDEIEAIRTFDPLTQRSIEKRDGMALKPVSEVLLDDTSIQRFRTRYREQFGTVQADDALYEAVSAGRRHVGMEHWLPLYYESLDTLFDYLPGWAVTLDPRADEIRASRLEQVGEFYAARKSLTGAGRTQAAIVYRPIPPDQMFLGDAEWNEILSRRSVAAFSPFEPPEGTVAAYDAGGRPGQTFADARVAADRNVFEAVRDRIAALQGKARKVAVAAFSPGSAERLRSVLTERGVAEVEVAESWASLQEMSPKRVGVVVLPLDNGYEAGRLTLIGEQDILGDRMSRPPKRRRNFDKFIAEVSNITAGDLVVHAEHGIGRYDGLVTLEISGAPHDCLRLVYQGDAKLFVPVESIDVLSRYGSGESDAQLDRLGGVAWQSRKARVKQRIKDIADELIKVAAERQLREGETVQAPEGLYDEFAARFPYVETDDQLKAIGDTLTDMASGQPMDRLICGDVGFGKTEVALRAAFVAAMSGHQVAVVVPTTLLCRQHYRNFTNRFTGLPLRVEQLSRLVTAKHAAEIRADLVAGKVDLVVGTQALLSKNVQFKDLGLLIIDEEQHFGVAQKEKLKQLKANVHVLTLTATPIPRTLQMALSGVREMSIIATPPIDRLAVRTFVLPFDPVVVREAIQRERNRGGQSFYIVPHISDLDEVRDELTRLVPDMKVAVANGRMAPTELEDVMTAFDDGRYDILLATNIVESGLDIPAANTMIIHRADRFGLAQLYQLRGRVGRAKTRAYAYLTIPPGKLLSETAQKRLEVMQTLDTLGAGFTLASHDLDIRGAGNLLGGEQSGHVREVGVELYQHMLEEAVATARSASDGDGAKPPSDEWTPQIAIGTSVLIPETYVADLGIRLGLYRRVSTLIDQGEIDGFAAEMIDRFGSLPPEVENLLQIVAIKRLCVEAGVDKVDAGPKGAVISFRRNSFANPAGLIAFIQEERGVAKLRPDQKLVYGRAWETVKERVPGVRNLLARLVRLAHGEAAAPAAAAKADPPPSVQSGKQPVQKHQQAGATARAAARFKAAAQRR